MKELVSILIPAYNAERWLKNTLESVLNQKWPNKEVIIVDDGSNDNTLRVARRFESKSVKVVTQKNMGVCSARNKALSLAQGDYIQWLDADDLLASNKISNQMKYIHDGLNSRVLLSGVNGIFYFRTHKAKFIRNPLWQDLSPVDWLINKFTKNVWLNPAAWLVSRKLTELAGPWDERIILNNDGEYFCRVVSKSEFVKFVPEAKTYYRKSHVNSISRRVSYKACESLFLSNKLCINYLRSLEDSERTRSAGLILLQDLMPYFYPEKKELLKKTHAFAGELSGTVIVPKETRLFFLFRKLLGWKMTKHLKHIFSNIKLIAYYNLDKVLYYLSFKLSKPF